MSPSRRWATVIFRFNLGLASKFPKECFPLEYYKTEDTLGKGNLLLSATLGKMQKIADMDVDLNTDEHFRLNTRAQYER